MCTCPNRSQRGHVDSKLTCGRAPGRNILTLSSRRFEGSSPTYMIQLKRFVSKSWFALQRRAFADMASQHSHLTYSPLPSPRLDLRGFHWIGFDLDYTVARYHNDLIRLVQQCTTRALEHQRLRAVLFRRHRRVPCTKGYYN